MRLTKKQLKQLIKEMLTEEFNLHQLSDLQILPSSIHGKGVFTSKQVPAETDLGVAQIKKEDGTYDITRLGRYHNHTSEPSCYNKLIGNKRHLYTLKDLAPGDEVTIDYNLQPELEQPKAGWK